jgi:hypothetical protein
MGREIFGNREKRENAMSAHILLQLQLLVVPGPSYRYSLSLSFLESRGPAAEHQGRTFDPCSNFNAMPPGGERWCEENGDNGKSILFHSLLRLQ